MQDLTPRLDANAQLIQSYGPGGFRIANVDYVSAVRLTPDTTQAWDGVLDLAAIEPFLKLTPAPEVLLIGTGARHTLLPRDLRDAIAARGLAVDTMATGAAARTFNILLGEARRVVALLMLP